MAGWLKRENGSSVEQSSDTHRKARGTDVCFDLENLNNGDKKIKPLFDEFLEAFLKEVCGVSCFRPLPPVIGEGFEVDLFKLHIVVKSRGGFGTVTKNGLWSLVAIDCGFDLRIGAALKLVYVKYLDTLDRWLCKIVKGKPEEKIKEKYLRFSGLLMELDSNLKVVLTNYTDKVKKDDEFVDFKKTAFENGEDEHLGFVNVDVRSVGENIYAKKIVGNGDDLAINEDSVSRKRKRECHVSMLNWIRMVAKNPCNPAIGTLPERHKWKYYGSELIWKQILSVREAMLLKKNADAGSQQSSVWQKKQKMHPSMYDDELCSSERLRCSQRLLFAKDTSRKAIEQLGFESSSDSQDNENLADKPFESTADSAGFWFSNQRHKRIPTGPHFQAELPDFCGSANYNSDLKWLGTKIWPLEKSEMAKKTLIERDPIGKGRQESCGCQFPGSHECVRFHIRGKRMKTQLELGSAFYKWNFDLMGEDVALSWTKEDEAKFQRTVETNRLSSDKYFWDELFENFPKEGREALVSYYFNVFLLRRRGCQNRSNPTNINSDDEDSEFGPIANRFGQIAAKSPGSIFCSPKKLNSK